MPRLHALKFLAVLVPALATAASCSSLGESRVIGPFTLVITPTSTPALTAKESKVFEAQRSIPLPLVAPPSAPVGTKVAPYSRVLWFSADDLRVQLNYVITNVGDNPLTVELTVDLWNEFVRYKPAVHIGEQGATIDSSTVDRLILVPAKGRAIGTVAYDDFEQAAFVLATLMNKPAEPYHVLDPHTHLTTDPLTMAYVPSQIAGATGFDLGIRTTEPASIALEATVELVDQGEHLMKVGEVSANGPPDKTYAPPPAR